MSENKHFVIDFDSTFTQVEALDVLGEISLASDPDKKKNLAEVEALTDKGMKGEISFRESLVERLRLLKANKNDLPALVENLSERVSSSFVRNREFFNDHHENIYIVSNGFKEFIVPIVEPYGVKPKNVFANTFEYDEEGNIAHFNYYSQRLLIILL